MRSPPGCGEGDGRRALKALVAAPMKLPPFGPPPRRAPRGGLVDSPPDPEEQLRPPDGDAVRRDRAGPAYAGGELADPNPALRPRVVRRLRRGHEPRRHPRDGGGYALRVRRAGGARRAG